LLPAYKHHVYAVAKFIQKCI